jgi:GAF domain-containing protein
MARGRETTGDFARDVQRLTDPDERLQRGVELVVELVDGCDHAGVTIVSRNGVTTAAASDDLVLRGDELQYGLGEGPCLDAVRAQRTVISQDLTVDHRWPRWAPQVVSTLGVRAMMSLLLYTQQDSLGALNLYGHRQEAWDDDDISVAHSLAGHLAVAVADAREIQHRGRAMVNRTTIGQAEGILMERYKITGDEAFERLRRVSQDSNRKLASVAEELVLTGRLPQPAASRAASAEGSRTGDPGGEQRRP